MEPTLNIGSPKVVKIGATKFFVFKDANPKPLVPPKGCRDGLNAECVKGVNLDECMVKCAENKNCGFGYFIRKGDDTTCLPLYSGSYFPDANPLYYVKPKDAFPETKEAITATFLRGEWLPGGNPPNDANSVFKWDTLRLGDTFGRELGLTKGLVKMVLSGSDLTILSSFTSRLLDKVDYGSFVSFIQGDRKSSIVLENPLYSPSREVSTDVLVGAPHRNWQQSRRSAFQIIPVNKIEDTALTYGEPFVLRIMDQLVASEKETGDLILLPEALGQWGVHIQPPYRHDMNYLAKRLLETGRGIIFTFLPRKKVYQCDEGKCNQVNLSDCKVKGQIATYKGKPTMIHPQCYYSCNWHSNKDSEPNLGVTNSQKWTAPVVGLSIALVIVIIVMLL